MSKYPIGPNLKIKFKIDFVAGEDEFGFCWFNIIIPQNIDISDDSKPLSI